MRVGHGTGHLEAQRTLHSWGGIERSSAVAALRAVVGPKEALGECQEISVSLDVYQQPAKAPGRTLPGSVLLLQPRDTAVGCVE